MEGKSTTAPLAAADAAFARADWALAKRLYLEALEAEETAEALDGLGQARWWLGERDAAIEDRKRAYALFRRAGEAAAAAQIAVYLSAEARIAGNRAAADGWLARASGLLVDVELCPAHGWLEIEGAKRADDLAAQEEHAERALTIARQLGNADIEVMALSQLGLASISVGKREEGLTFLDEAMAAAMGGEASDALAIGDTCCTTLVACDRLDDFRRAVDWCRVVVEFTESRNYTPLAAWCRTVYAGVLVRTGDWERAETELLASLKMYQRLRSSERMFALARLAELRLRQGRIGEAEQLLDGYEDHPLALLPVVSLHLERGDVATADALLERRLRGAGEGVAETASLLPLLIDVRLVTGDLAAAEDALARFQDYARTVHVDHLLAVAEAKRASISLFRGDRVAANAEFSAAIDLFVRAEMPHEEGGARLNLARLLAAEASPLALPEARAALNIFERLGASRDADAAAHFLRSLGVSGRTGPRNIGTLTRRETDVLVLLGEGLTNAEIASRLFIAPKTAEHHVGRVLRKLNLRTRAEAAAYAVRVALEQSETD